MTLEVEEFLAQYRPEIRDLALRLRTLVLELVPEAGERVDFGNRLLCYRPSEEEEEEFVFIGPCRVYVNLSFPRGVELSDPTDLLLGTGRRERHVRLEEGQLIPELALRSLVEQARALSAGGSPPPPRT